MSSRGAGALAVAPPIADASHDPCLSALSAAVAELVADHGRRPSSASSWRLDDSCVVTALEDFLTPAERALVEEGQESAVRELRTAFGEAMRDAYVRAAAGALQREVIAHRSEVICDSATCLEIFLLADEQRIPSVGPLPVPAPRAEVTDPRTFVGGKRRPRRAVSARSGALLNAHWHKPLAISTSPRCPACDAEVHASDHAVRYGGELFHPDCALHLR